MLHSLLLLDLQSKFCLDGLIVILLLLQYLYSFIPIHFSTSHVSLLSCSSRSHFNIFSLLFSLLQSTSLHCRVNSNTKTKKTFLIFMIRLILMLMLLLRNLIYAELIFVLAFSSVYSYKYFSLF